MDEPSRDSPDRKPTRGLPQPDPQIEHLPGSDDPAHRAKNVLASVMARLSILKLDGRIPEDVCEELDDIAQTCLEAGELIDAMYRAFRRRKAG